MAVIGSIGPGRTGEAQRRVDPEAFGVGVGRAIRGIAQSLGEFDQSRTQLAAAEQQLGLTYKDRQDKLERARLDVELIRTDGALGRQLTELGPQALPGARGFTGDATKLIDETYDKFLAAVPAPLRDEYTGRVASAREAKVSSAFNYEIQQGDEAYRMGAAEMAQAAIDDIVSGRSTYAKWQGLLDLQFQNSPLDANETGRLKATLLSAIEKAEFGKVATDMALDPSSGAGAAGPADGSDIVAAGVPGQMRGLLNAIASVEAKDYQTMNGGEHFSSYADHPGRSREGTSSAAGRYQFIKGTWEAAKAALGLPDFSPESQDRAAIWLAQRDYSARTGRNLMTDLGSGDPTLIAGVRSVLAGQGDKNVTWQGLQTITNEQFIQRVTGQAGTPSVLLQDNLYPNISYTDKLALLGDAQKSADQLAKQSEDARQARLQQTMLDLQTQIINGQGRQPAIDEAWRAGMLSPSDFTTLTKQQATFETTQRDALDFSVVSSAPGYVYDPSDESAVKRYEAKYRQDLAPAMARLDGDAFRTQVLPLVTKTNSMPAGMASQLQGMIMSADPKQAEFGLQAIGAIRQQATLAFAQLAPETQSSAFFYSTMRGVLPQEQLMQEIRGINSPELAAVHSLRAQAIQQEIAKNPKDFALAPLLEEFGADVGGSQLVADAFQQDILELYRYEFPRYGAHGPALAAAKEKAKLIWGQTAIGTGSFMKRPPEKVYGTVDGSYDYMSQQLTTDYPLKEGERLKLVSDGRSEEDFFGHRPVSYALVKTDTDGLIHPLTDRVADVSGIGRPRLQRYFFTPQYKPTDPASPEAADRVLATTAFRQELQTTTTPPLFGQSSRISDGQQTIVDVWTRLLKEDPTNTFRIKRLQAEVDELARLKAIGE